MDVRTLEDLYEKELLEARSVESQISQCLPKMIEAASDEALRGALEDHLVQTRSQIERIDRVLQGQDTGAESHSDQSMERMIEEASSWVQRIDDPQVRDAALIASIQRVKHYEMAVYGALTTWAKLLDRTDDAETLHRILEEEKAADEHLARLAKREVNPQAAT